MTHDHDARAETLDRFVDAQDHDDTYARALAELEAGRKTSHWMWYVLPQLRGLGRSATAHRYGLDGRREAEAYARHPVLGPRLVACVRALLAHTGTPIEAILGETDAIKFRSCATLFAAVAPGEPAFRLALERFHGGEADAATLRLLGDVDAG
jgi:uncharacterized protein (DUF1810 family)